MGNVMRLYNIDTLAMKPVNDAPDNVSIAMLARKLITTCDAAIYL